MGLEHQHDAPGENMGFHMIAGALAGILEHIIMFPIDTVKTRMQSLSLDRKATMTQVFRDMVKGDGITRPLRGFQIVFVGDGPGHAIHFATYEYSKRFLIQKMEFNAHMAHACSGMIATVFRDAIMTPADAVKQRIQMKDSPYRGIVDCVRQVSRNEGLSVFYRAYTTQLSMNIPYQGIHFMCYEIAKSLINPSGDYNPVTHMISGAAAGGFAAAVTTPLDVCKTFLNTQEVEKGGPRVSGLSGAVVAVYKRGGALAFWKGIKPRAIYQMPSTALCWSIYEFWKWILITN